MLNQNCHAYALLQEMQHLKSLYTSMATSFSEGGFNVASIASVQHLFVGSEPSSAVQPRPKLYSEAVPGIAPGSTRLLALPLEQSPEVTSATQMVAQRIGALLPPGLRVSTAWVRRMLCASMAHDAG